MIVKARGQALSDGMTGGNASKEERAERLAAQLRANLTRRKQARRAEVAAADDQRTSASDPSDVAAPAA